MCFSRFLLGSLIVGTLFFQSELQSQELKVLVLDALNGAPQANVKVEPFCAGPPLNFFGKSAFTDDKGIATISYVCNETQVIEIEVFPPIKKEQCGGGAPLSFHDISSVGFVSK